MVCIFSKGLLLNAKQQTSCAIWVFVACKLRSCPWLAFAQRCRMLGRWWYLPWHAFPLIAGCHTSCLLWLVQPGVISVTVSDIVILGCLLFHSSGMIIADEASVTHCARLEWLWSQLLFVLRGHSFLLLLGTADMKVSFDVGILFVMAFVLL